MAKAGVPTRGRAAAARVKSAKGRKISSTRWLERQLNDPYVAAAKREGYRSRAAYKLAELDDRFRFLRGGKRVLDLGAAPGGWTQIAVARVGKAKGTGKVVGIDLLPIDPIPGAILFQGDFLGDGAEKKLLDALGGAPDAILSDMAAPATGHAATDHIRIVALVEAAYEFAREHLAPGGTFVAKVFQGGTERELLERMKKDFASVKHAKPPASRAESAEVYVVAQGFRGSA
jgi:23S rRNA (uridine2552-2'-O)-methyltransferase